MKKPWYHYSMSMITTTHVDDAQHLFIFRANQILTVKQDVLSPPPAEIYHKFLEYQLATDWFCEPEQGYAAMLLEETASEPTGCHWCLSGRSSLPSMSWLLWWLVLWLC